jgi:hypothetical protein
MDDDDHAGQVAFNLHRAVAGAVGHQHGAAVSYFAWARVLFTHRSCIHLNVNGIFERPYYALRVEPVVNVCASSTHGQRARPDRHDL